MLDRDKRSSLLQKFVTYDRKKFYNIGHLTELISLLKIPERQITDGFVTLTTGHEEDGKLQRPHIRP